jgi:predicted DNA binding CopG/RHH family protein
VPKARPVSAPFTYSDDEERELYDAIESEKHVPVNLLTRRKKAEVENMARAKMNEARVKISLRLPQTDLDKLKARAMREGMPYQTLINSILHKAVAR